MANRLVRLFNPNVWETTLSVICEKDESVSNSIGRQLEMIQQFGAQMTNLGASIRVFNPARLRLLVDKYDDDTGKFTDDCTKWRSDYYPIDE